MQKRRSLQFAFAVVAAVSLNACAGPGGITVQDAWTRPALEGNNSAIYLVLENHQDLDDALTGVSVEGARAVELHESMIMDMGDELDEMVEGGDGNMEDMRIEGVMQMTPLDRVQISARQRVAFEPGGLHIMLIELDQDLMAGEMFPVILHFEHSDDISVQVQIQER